MSLAEVIRAMHVDVTGLGGDAMRGTDGANTTTPPTVGEIQAELEENGDSILDSINDLLPASTIAAATDISADSAIADAVLDEVVEGSMTLRQILRVALSGLAGKSTGGGTSTLTFRDLADAKARITATVDANGNRTAMTLDGS